MILLCWLKRVLGPPFLTHNSLVLAQLAMREELYEIRDTHPPPSPEKEPETSPRRAREECLANWEQTAQAIEREMGEGKRGEGGQHRNTGPPHLMGLSRKFPK